MEDYAERPELFQVENPQARDTFVTNSPTGPTWTIVRYQVVNQGPFLFRCHVETQMSNGMADVLDSVDIWPQVPAREDKSPGAQVKLAGLEKLVVNVLLVKAAHLSSLTLTCQFLVESLCGLPHLKLYPLVHLCRTVFLITSRLQSLMLLRISLRCQLR
jgi:hypothetical protein